MNLPNIAVGFRSVELPSVRWNGQGRWTVKSSAQATPPSVATDSLVAPELPVVNSTDTGSYHGRPMNDAVAGFASAVALIVTCCCPVDLT